MYCGACPACCEVAILFGNGTRNVKTALAEPRFGERLADETGTGWEESGSIAECEPPPQATARSEPIMIDPEFIARRSVFLKRRTPEPG
jgi:hypothetical protein